MCWKINNQHPDEDRFTYTKFDQRELTNTSFRDISLCNDTDSSQRICTQIENGDILFLFCILVLFPIKSLNSSFVFALRRPHNYVCTLWFASFKVEETCFF